MMFVLLAALLLSVVTVGILRMVAADITEGFGGLQVVQAFSVAEAGVHYAIGQLQTATADAYAGETISIASGSTTLGTTTITVNCIVSGSPPPCTGASDAAYVGYRRIVSTSTLPTSGASGGPTRTIVAVVQGTPSGGGSWSSAFCALTSVSNTTESPDVTKINGDIVSNGSILLTPQGSSGSTPGTIQVLGDPGSPQKYTGKVAAVGTATCGTGCSAAGGVLSGQPGPNLCSAPPLPTFAPGATDVTVASGATYTMNPGRGYSFNNVTLASGTCSGANPFTTLNIVAPGGPGTTTVVQLNTLAFGSCGRLMISGAGNIDLRLGAPTGTGLQVGLPSTGSTQHFGVGPTDTFSISAPVPASQLKVWVNSNGTGSSLPCQDSPTSCAVFLSHASGGATIIAPNGLVQVDDSASPNPMYGAVLANKLLFSGNGTFNSDTSGLSSFSTTYANFNSLRSWKDQ